MRTTAAGIAGCIATLSLEQWSQAAAIAAGFSTFAWMAVQCVIALRRDAREAAASHPHPRRK